MTEGDGVLLQHPLLNKFVFLRRWNARIWFGGIGRRLRRSRRRQGGGSLGRQGRRAGLRDAHAAGDEMGPRWHLRQRRLHSQEAHAPGGPTWWSHTGKHAHDVAKRSFVCKQRRILFKQVSCLRRTRKVTDGSCRRLTTLNIIGRRLERLCRIT